MIHVRKSHERGKTQTEWLKSYHTFSFGDYYDPQCMGLSHLRVINEDIIQPSTGFGQHPHQHMEIITYVIEGALEHQDTLGTGSMIKPGEIQRMSAGTGIKHSEFNHSKTNPLHLLQIWIVPNEKNLSPSYEQKTISQKQNALLLIGSPKGEENSITIHQDVKLFVGYFTQDNYFDYELKQRKAWLQLIKGKITLNSHLLLAGDGAAILEDKIKITCEEDAEFLLFDLS